MLPLSSATPDPVEIDEFINMFDAPTRTAIRENLVEFGNAVAGRGPVLNEALAELPGALEVLEPVMRNLASPETGLDRFVAAISAAAAEVAPVAETQAELFVNLDTTFTSLARVARPFIQETISETPPTFAVATETLPTIRPFLRNSATLFTELRPGIQELASTAPTIGDALETGVPALRESPALNRELAPTTEALQRFNDNAGVRSGLSRLAADGRHLRAGDPVHRPGADRLQLRHPAVPQRGQRDQQRYGRALAAGDRVRASKRPEQRGHLRGLRRQRRR